MRCGSEHTFFLDAVTMLPDAGINSDEAGTTLGRSGHNGMRCGHNTHIFRDAVTMLPDAGINSDEAVTTA